MVMNREREKVTLTRDCDAIQIPSGIETGIAAGTEVEITQQLGESFTVITDMGVMARIEGKDADALGKERPEELPEASVEEARQLPVAELETRVWEQLRMCYDPEIPVNIVDLGLVYHCAVLELEDGRRKAELRMTVTAPGCGMADIICADAEARVRSVPGISETDFAVVFDPPWTMDMMTDAARLELGMF